MVEAAHLEHARQVSAQEADGANPSGRYWLVRIHSVDNDGIGEVLEWEGEITPCHTADGWHWHPVGANIQGDWAAYERNPEVAGGDQVVWLHGAGGNGPNQITNVGRVVEVFRGSRPSDDTVRVYLPSRATRINLREWARADVSGPETTEPTQVPRAHLNRLGAMPSNRRTIRIVTHTDPSLVGTLDVLGATGQAVAYAADRDSTGVLVSCESGNRVFQDMLHPDPGAGPYLIVDEEPETQPRTWEKDYTNTARDQVPAGTRVRILAHGDDSRAVGLVGTMDADGVTVRIDQDSSDCAGYTFMYWLRVEEVVAAPEPEPEGRVYSLGDHVMVPEGATTVGGNSLDFHGEAVVESGPDDDGDLRVRQVTTEGTGLLQFVDASQVTEVPVPEPRPFQVGDQVRVAADAEGVYFHGEVVGEVVSVSGSIQVRASRADNGAVVTQFVAARWLTLVEEVFDPVHPAPGVDLTQAFLNDGWGHTRDFTGERRGFRLGDRVTASGYGEEVGRLVGIDNSGIPFRVWFPSLGNGCTWLDSVTRADVSEPETTWTPEDLPPEGTFVEFTRHTRAADVGRRGWYGTHQRHRSLGNRMWNLSTSRNLHTTAWREAKEVEPTDEEMAFVRHDYNPDATDPRPNVVAWLREERGTGPTPPAGTLVRVVSHFDDIEIPGVCTVRHDGVLVDSGGVTWSDWRHVVRAMPEEAAPPEPESEGDGLTPPAGLDGKDLLAWWDRRIATERDQWVTDWRELDWQADGAGWCGSYEEWADGIVDHLNTRRVNGSVVEVAERADAKRTEVLALVRRREQMWATLRASARREGSAYLGDVERVAARVSAPNVVGRMTVTALVSVEVPAATVRSALSAESVPGLTVNISGPSRVSQQVRFEMDVERCICARWRVPMTVLGHVQSAGMAKAREVTAVQAVGCTYCGTPTTAPDPL